MCRADWDVLTLMDRQDAGVVMNGLDMVCRGGLQPWRFIVRNGWDVMSLGCQGWIWNVSPAQRFDYVPDNYGLGSQVGR